MKKYYAIAIIILLIILGIFLAWRWLNIANQKNISKHLNAISQNPQDYMTHSLNITEAQQSQLAQNFLSLYFSPWHNQPNSFSNQILKSAETDLHGLLRKPVWQFTKEKFSADLLKTIGANANLDDFPNINRPAIIVHVTQARFFPTLLPAYGDPQAGNFYPFDRWINSYIYTGTPIWVFQQSKDHNWYLIKTASYYGWTPSEDVAFVDENFMNQWQQQHFVTTLRDAAPLYSEDSQAQQAIGSLRLGMIYPAITSIGNQVQIFMPYMDERGHAKIRTVLANSDDVQPFPMPGNKNNMVQLSNQLMGTPYGWGDLYQLRDCSSTISNLLAGFGLWVPRNSYQQARIGKIIQLKNLSREEKLKIIAEQGVPFQTILYFPGHVALYIGMKDKQAYTLQQVWSGVRTTNLIRNVVRSKAAIGKTIIIPLDFGKYFSNVPTFQLDSLISMSVLLPETYQNPQKILEDIWS